MKTSILTLVTASLVANTALADPKEVKYGGEGPGIAAGTVIGGIAGGPVGMIVAGALGGWISNKIHSEKKTRENYQAAWEESEALATSLEELLADNRTELEQVRLVMHERETGFATREADYRDALQQALDIEVYFHTGESTLDERVAERVERLGELMLGFEDFAIVVEGHADPRGEAAYNEQLSAERAAAVREALIRAGLPAGRVTTRAAGESDSAAAEGDLDAMALERRADLSIVRPLTRDNRVASQ